ncbi:LysR substrate-binding domain-containing protein, partial [Paraburkholderia sediminicola]|uniref:LysR substrate-binding domain-containing protein n=1 Tax=Paraburkholderia sediminicola TaxID=458836 RepID=UPI0038B7928F
LTEDAREYFALCVEVFLERLRDGEQCLLSERNESKGALRFVAHPIAIEAGSPQLISQYRSNAPDISVIVSTSSEPLRLQQGTCDLAVYRSARIEYARAVYCPFLRSRYVHVASRSYLERHRPQHSAVNFAGHFLLLCGTGTAVPADLRFEGDAGVAATASPEPTVVVDTAAAIRLALSGFGMTPIPEFLVAKYLAEG